MTLSKINNKLDSLQLIRGFAAIMVVMSHIWNDGWLPGTFNELGAFGVDIFFVLSGFIMCFTVKLNTGSNYLNSKTFIIKRLVRIYPIYMICALPIILYVLKVNHDKDLYYFIGNLLLLPSFNNDPNYRLALSPGWSLTYEIFFYLIFSVVLLFSSNKRKILLTIFCVLIGLVVCVNASNSRGGEDALVNFNYMIGDPRLLCFASGIVCYYLYLSFKEKINFHIKFSLVLLGIIVFLAMVLIYLKLPHLLSRGLPAAAIIMIFSLTGNSSIEGKPIQKVVFFGDASYSIYLTHFYFIDLKFKILDKLINYFDSKMLLINILGISLFIIAVIFGCIFYLLVEKKVVGFLSKKVRY